MGISNKLDKIILQPSEYTIENLKTLNVLELKKICQTKKIPGYYKCKKI
jgi:hypothetical protein